MTKRGGAGGVARAVECQGGVHERLAARGVARACELVKRAPRLLAPRPRRAPIPITLCMLSPF